jgi:hypothetical protein
MVVVIGFSIVEVMIGLLRRWERVVSEDRSRFRGPNRGSAVVFEIRKTTIVVA